MIERLRIFLSTEFNKNAAINSLSIVILGLGGILLAPILDTRGAEALGVFNQAYSLYIIYSQIGVGGVQFSVLKHISYVADDQEESNDILLSAIALVGFIASLVSLFGWWTSAWVGNVLQSDDVALAIKAIMPALIFFSINKVLISGINGLSKMVANAIFRSLRFILIPFFLTILVFSPIHNALLPLAFLFTEAVLCLAMTIYIYSRLLPLKKVRRFWFWWKEHFSFGIKGMLAGLLIELNTRIDVLLLGYFTSDSIVGIYSFAAIFAEGFAQIPIALRWNVDPIIGGLFSKGKILEISDFAIRIRRTYQPLIIGIGALAILSYPLILLILNGQVSTESWIVLGIIILGVALSSGIRLNSGIILQSGRPALQSAITLSIVTVNILFGWLLIPYFGIFGAAFVTSLSYLIEAGLLIIISARVLKIPLIST